MENILKYCWEKYGEVEFDHINAHVPVFPSTGSEKAPVEVEVHWRAQAMTNLFRNLKLQKCFESEKIRKMMVGEHVALNFGTSSIDSGTITVPAWEFNVFYQMLHCYHHMFESGLGLGQLMD